MQLRGCGLSGLIGAVSGKALTGKSFRSCLNGFPYQNPEFIKGIVGFMRLTCEPV